MYQQTHIKLMQEAGVKVQSYDALFGLAERSMQAQVLELPYLVPLSLRNKMKWMHLSKSMILLHQS